MTALSDGKLYRLRVLTSTTRGKAFDKTDDGAVEVTVAQKSIRSDSSRGGTALDAVVLSREREAFPEAGNID